jgi:DNA-binding NtrC family response regulator
LQRVPVDVVLSDLRMPGMDGLELTRKIREEFPEIGVVILTGNGTIASAVECIKAGANDYILKPAAADALEVAFDRAMASRALKREVDYLRRVTTPSTDEDWPIGQSPAWTAVMKLVQAAAASDSTVLLRGESGTGKELLAKLIHRLSPRASGPCVRVNCAAIPMEMWESEFFGHRRGALTGATADREGRFRLADGGTLFMDEVGATPLPAQAKILRVLQDGEFERPGDQQPTRVDVRIVAASHRDLDSEVAAGRFREDLYYRINVIDIELPPLRDRREDIPLLAQSFVAEIASRYRHPAPQLGREVQEELMAYSWPGNVRELQNVLERALILNPGEELTLPDLPHKRSVKAEPEGTPADLNLRSVLARREKEVLVAALRRAAGVRKEAARLLGIDQRNLPYYLRKHAVDPDRLDD